VAFSLAYRMCGSRPRAEDVVQEAFLSLWRSGARYDRARGSVRTWTLGIVHNRAVDTLRRSGTHERRQVSDEGIEETLEAPERTEAQAIDNATSKEIRGALAELPAEQRRVIELAYFGGFTHTEIASMLTTPVGTVKGRMRLGLRKLRDELKEWEAAGA
jgi:RNA polymerase sigma-70 factor (ECF subfamily)